MSTDLTGWELNGEVFSKGDINVYQLYSYWVINVDGSVLVNLNYSKLSDAIDKANDILKNVVNNQTVEVVSDFR